MIEAWAGQLLSAFPHPPKCPEDWVNVESFHTSLCTIERRKKLGQFMTPPAVASFMAGWVLGCNPNIVLDPAIGLGIFPWTILNRAPNLKVLGFDIDPEMVKAARSLVPGLKARQEDFLTLQHQEHYDAIICNPPYIRHHAAKIPKELYAYYSEVIGERLSRLTNIYALFLIAITQRLKIGGRAAVITPAEYLNANFGVAIKRYLLEKGLLSGLVIFDHAAEVFGNALTTASIALLEAPARQEKNGVSIYRIKNISELEQLEQKLNSAPLISHSLSLVPEDKWQSIGQIAHHAQGSTLGDIVRCCRGIATGANHFFTLSCSEAEDFGLPKECLIPCITKSSHVPKTLFDETDLQRLIDSDRKVFLVNTAIDHPAVKEYLAMGEAQGIHKRYIPSHRNPWYALERREPAPIWVTVFGRGSFRFIRNRTKALNLTTFHCIYPKKTLPPGVSVEDLSAYLNSLECRSAIRMQMRVYGGGLEKLEPRDVLRIGVSGIRS